MKTNAISHFIFSILVLFVTNSMLAQTELVYADNFAANWWPDSWSGNTANTQYTTGSHLGSRCIQVVYNNWGYFGFDHRKEDWTENYYFYPNQYKYINFYFKTANTAAQMAYVGVTLDLGETAMIKDYISGAVSPNTWYNVRIPISAMNPDNKKFFRIYFGNETSNNTPTIYIDDVYLEYVADNTPPVISNFAVKDIEQDIATVSWNTDEPVIYTFKYRIQGSTGAYTTLNSTEYEPGGEINLKNLTSNTNYEYILECKDHQKENSTPANTSTKTGSFKTTTADVAAPVISNLRVIEVFANRAVIGWDTDEPSNTVLSFGEGNYTSTKSESLFKRTHTVVLTHIKPSTTYQYKVSSTDRFGNKKESIGNPVFSFTSLAETTQPLRWVVTDHPIYQWDEVGPNEVPWHQITHLNLGQLWPVRSDSGYTLGIEPNSYWSDDWGGYSRWKTEAKQYIASGHNARRKVICMLGGAGSNPSGDWNTATSSANIKTFVKNIRKVLEGIGFDGTDLDWEDNIDFPSFINLAKELRDAWPNAIITIPAGLNGDDATDFAPAKNYVDAFTPMSYYPIPQWGGWIIPIPITPLYSAGDNPYSIKYTLDQWKAAGVSSNKIIMGVGGFGAIWGDNNEDGVGPIGPYVNINNLALNANGETESVGSDNLVTWSFVNDVLEANPKLYEGWDEIGKCNYWHTGDINKQIEVLYPGRSYYLNISLIFYETARSMSNKVKFIEDNTMKGVGYWTLSQLIHDDFSPVLDVASCLKLDTTSLATSVKTFQDKPFADVKIYPNPVLTNLCIDIINSKTQIHVRIIDSMGKTVLEKPLVDHINYIKFPDSKGVYYLVLSDKSGKVLKTQKIIKM